LGLYIVQRDGWYSERVVWGIAGVVILAGTLLAWQVHPVFALLVTATGAFSWVTASTGFCVMSSLLVNLGFTNRLGDVVPTRFGLEAYWMRTDRWFLERGIYAVVGTTQTVASLLAVVHHPGWLGFTGFVGAMAVGFAWSGFCPVANALYVLGFEPRLAPDPEPMALPVADAG
jgi:hypothetical protein